MCVLPIPVPNSFIFIFWVLFLPEFFFIIAFSFFKQWFFCVLAFPFLLNISSVHVLDFRSSLTRILAHCAFSSHFFHFPSKWSFYFPLFSTSLRQKLRRAEDLRCVVTASLVLSAVKGAYFQPALSILPAPSPSLNPA